MAATVSSDSDRRLVDKFKATENIHWRPPDDPEAEGETA